MGSLVRSWFHLGRETVRRFQEAEGAFLAAGIAFYAFFSIFPLALLSITALSYLLSLPWLGEQLLQGLAQLDRGGLRASPGALGGTLQVIDGLLPSPSSWLAGELAVMAREWGSSLVLATLLGVGSGRQLFLALEVSLHRLWRVPRRRGLLRRNLMAMALIGVCGGVTFLSLGLLGFLGLVERVLGRFKLVSYLGWTLDQAQLWRWAVFWVVLPVLVGGILMLLYRALPSERLPLRCCLIGAVFSAVAWRLASLLYLEYVERVGSVSIVYGSIWYVIGLMVWLYMVAVVFLLGGGLVQACADQGEA